MMLIPSIHGAYGSTCAPCMTDLIGAGDDVSPQESPQVLSEFSLETPAFRGF